VEESTMFSDYIITGRVNGETYFLYTFSNQVGGKTGQQTKLKALTIAGECSATIYISEIIIGLRI
jgi:hypothetical protein